jgi:LMBR1 domain-containing protein 1
LFFNKGQKGIDAFKNESDKFKWVQNLFDAEHSNIILTVVGESAIAFTFSVFSLLGMFFLILYTGYGLGSLPFYLIKGKKSLSTAHYEMEMDKAEVRQRIRSLQEKQTRKGLSNKEKKELQRLRDDEHNIDKKINKISSLLESDHMVSKLLTILTPFRVIIGMVSLVLSVLIFLSLFTTSLDRLLHSKCGWNCGYVLDDRNYTNYLDFLLLELSKYFHLDYPFFAFINLYVYICSIYGFVRLGVKFFFITWFDIKKGSTNPQGLLVMSFMVLLMILSFMNEMLTLAPQYSTFGTQKFSKNSKQGEVPCNLSLITEQNECIMSNISKFYDRVSISLPFFSSIFFIANWCLIIILGFSILTSAFREEEAVDIEEDVEYDEEKAVLTTL